MALKIQLADGREVAIQATREQWEKALRSAAATKALLEIELPDGSVIVIDPHQVQSFREEPEAAAEIEEAFAAAG